MKNIAKHFIMHKAALPMTNYAGTNDSDVKAEDCVRQHEDNWLCCHASLACLFGDEMTVLLEGRRLTRWVRSPDLYPGCVSRNSTWLIHVLFKIAGSMHMAELNCTNRRIFF